jgi:hypothetical protein
MKFFVRLSSCVLVAFSLAALLAAVLLPAVGAPSLFSGEALEMGRRVFDELVRQEALAARDGAVLRVIEAKKEVVAGLIAGKLTLADAADRFAQLQGLVDDGQDDVLGPYRGVPHGDVAVCDNVLAWARGALYGNPREGEVMARLARQKRDYLAAKAKGPH